MATAEPGPPFDPHPNTRPSCSLHSRIARTPRTQQGIQPGEGDVLSVTRECIVYATTTLPTTVTSKQRPPGKMSTAPMFIVVVVLYFRANASTLTTRFKIETYNGTSIARRSRSYKVNSFNRFVLCKISTRASYFSMAISAKKSSARPFSTAAPANC